MRETAARHAGINFDDVTYTIVPITVHGTTYKLRDDISFELMVRAFKVQDLLAEMQEVGTTAEQDEEAAAEAFPEVFEDLRSETAQLVRDIFRHTFPTMDGAEIDGLFTMEQRIQLVNYFFILRSRAFEMQRNAIASESAQPAASSPAPAMDPIQTTTGPAAPIATLGPTARTAPNRATRRARRGTPATA